MLNIDALDASRADAHVPGAQMVALTARVLRALACGDAAGRRIVDLVEETGMARATVNRIVKALCLEGLAMRLQDRGAFALGPFAFELGIAATHFPLREAASASLDRIAAETGDTCFLMMRIGADAICVDRREGAFPVRALTIEVGHRRPLGAAAASLALLMHFSPTELDAHLRSNHARIKRYGMLTSSTVNEMVVRAKALGFALNNNNIIPEVSAVGVAIPARARQAYAALSVAALTSRIMSNGRHLEIAELLQTEAGEIAARLQVPLGVGSDINGPHL